MRKKEDANHVEKNINKERKKAKKKIKILPIPEMAFYESVFFLVCVFKFLCNSYLILLIVRRVLRFFFTSYLCLCVSENKTPNPKFMFKEFLSQELLERKSMTWNSWKS